MEGNGDVRRLRESENPGGAMYCRAGGVEGLLDSGGKIGGALAGE